MAGEEELGLLARRATSSPVWRVDKLQRALSEDDAEQRRKRPRLLPNGGSRGEEQRSPSETRSTAMPVRRVVWVKTLGGATLAVENATCAGEVRRALFERHGIDPTQARLVCSGSLVDDDALELPPGTVVRLVAAFGGSRHAAGVIETSCYLMT